MNVRIPSPLQGVPLCIAALSLLPGCATRRVLVLDEFSERTVAAPRDR